MSLNSSNPLQHQEIHHVLFWMPNWIGDVVLALPAIQALRRRFPDARFTAVAKPPAEELLETHPAVDSVIRLPYTSKDSVLDRWVFARNLRKYQFDLGVVFPNSLGSALSVFLSGAKFRFGYGTERRSLFLTHALPVDARRKRTAYRVDYFHHILAPLDVGPPPSSFDPLVRGNGARRIETWFREAGLGKKEFVVVVHPGTSKPQRAWHSERYGILCQKLIKDYGIKIVLLGTDRERPLLERVRRFCAEGSAHIVSDLSLPDIAALIGQCHLFVGNDSGMMHLAALVGTPVVGIFGPGCPETSGPYLVPEKLEVVTKRYPCSPCRQRFFKECRPSPHNKPYCLEDISVKDVAEAVDRLMTRWKKN